MTQYLSLNPKVFDRVITVIL